MSDGNFKAPNHGQKNLKQIVDVTKPGLKKVVDVDYVYMEKKEAYEQAKKAGLKVEPPEPSSFYLTRREQLNKSLIGNRNIVNSPEQSGCTIPPHNNLVTNFNVIDSNGGQQPGQVSSIQGSIPCNPNIGIRQNTGIAGVVPANSKIPQFSNIATRIGNFIVDKCGYFFLSKEGKWIRFTDFFIVIKCHENIIDVNGNVTRQFSIQLVNDQGNIKELSVDHENWTNLQNQIEHQAPEFQIFTDEYRNAGEKFKRLLGELLKHTQFEERSVYGYWGWGPLVNGYRRFYHGGLPDCKSEKCLTPPLDKQNFLNILGQAWGLFDVGDHEVVIPMIFYSLASYTDALFTDAGYPLAHCLMAIGDSGTKKTSFCKVVFAPFVFTNDRLSTVRATEASLEVLHEIFYDDTLVIDDFNMEGSPKEVRDKMSNIRSLIRAYSDKTPRIKYGGKDNIKKYAIRGGCVFTGETKLIGQLISSELRYIKVIFKKELDKDALAVFQNNRWIWQHVVAEFIRYLERNYIAIIAEVGRVFTQERSPQGLEASRLIDTFLHLKIVAWIFCNLCLEVGFLTKENAGSWFGYFTQILHQVVSAQDKSAVVQEPYIQFLAEFFNLYGTGKLVIAPDIKTYVQNMRNYIGYRDIENQTLMIKKDDTVNAVANAFIARNDYLPITSEDLSKILKREGLTKCDKDSCLKRAPSVIEGRPRMLALIEHKCIALLDNAKNSTK